MKQRVKVVPTCPNYANQKGTRDRIEEENHIVVLDNYIRFGELEFHANELILIDEVVHNVPEIHLKLAVKIEKRYEDVKAKLAKLHAPYDASSDISISTYKHGVRLQELQYQEELNWLKSLLNGE